MFRRKYENAKRFVKDHGVEIALGGIVILGTAVIGQQMVLNEMTKLHKKEVKTLGDLAKISEITVKGLELVFEETDALAELNGKTIEDVWKIALDKKYNLNDIK